MPRVKGGTVTRRRRKKVLKLAKGYFGSKHTLFKVAKQQVMKSGMYAFRDRRQTKRNFRRLWIVRINAAARLNGLSYSRLMNGLKVAGIDINRKMLSEIAIHDAAAFTSICEQAKAALEATLDAITGSLKKGEAVQLIGFGTFKVNKRAARVGRNPQTGAEIKIAASKVPAFVSGKALKDAIK